MFEPDRHEALEHPAWTEEGARLAVEELMSGIMAARRAAGGWLMHPLDCDYGTDHGNLSLYMGAAGVWWAAHHLRGLVAPPDDLVAAVRALCRQWPRDERDPDVPSAYLGQTGIWGVAVQAAGEPLLPRIEAAVDANAANPTWETLWGSPGTMEVAWHLGLRAAWDRSAQALLGALTEVDGLALWIHNLYGRARPIIGAGHGFAGNVHALLRPGGPALPLDALARTIETLAIREDGCANWAPEPDSSRRLVQWCHGAPGVITSLRSWPDDRLDGLLAEAGELVWRAGPLAKGASLCHGTAGNGFAFLTLHRRTGEARWLERARAFAMHAVAQVQRERAQHGQPRATLFTGDAGVACFVAACLDGDDRLPLLDVL